MCFETPQAPSATQTEGDTLAAQVKYAPQVFAENQEFSPQYTALDLQNLSSFLGGSGNTPGFLSEYANSIMPTLTSSQVAANTALRQGTISDATSMAPQLTSLANLANPGAASLLSNLTNTASQQLSYGTELTPAEQLQLTQSARGGAAARGMGFGPSDLLNEAFDQTNEGQALLSQREGQASSLVPSLESFYQNPLSMLAGIGSNAGSNASGITSAAMGGAAPAQSSEFNPESSMSQLLAGEGFDSAVAGANNANTWITAPTSFAESY